MLISPKTIIGIPGLIICATTSVKDDSGEPFPVTSDEVREHVWRDFWPFIHVEHFRIIDILWFVLMDLSSDHMFLEAALETEIAIAVNECFFHFTISHILMYYVWSHCPYGQSTYD